MATQYLRTEIKNLFGIAIVTLALLINIGCDQIPNKMTFTVLQTPNPALAGTFYEGLYQWRIEAAPFQQDWLQVDAGSGPGGLIWSQSAGQAGAWTVFFVVENVEDHVRGARLLGSTIVLEPQQWGDIGRAAMFTDPDGNVLGVIEAGPGLGNTLPVYFEIYSSDLDRAQRFYDLLFNWTMTPSEVVSGAVDVEVGSGPGGKIRVDVGSGPGGIIPYMASTDINADLANVLALGGSVVSRPTPLGEEAVISHVQDSTGVLFGLYQPLTE